MTLSSERTVGARLLMTGGSGLLGATLRALDASVVAPSHSEMDVTVAGSVEAALERFKPAVVLHAAAFTRNAAIREEPARALRVNIQGTANVAAACLERGLRLVFVSSDYVYADTPGPHAEAEPLLPLNAYAWTKLGGECAVRLVPDHLIIRTSFGPVPYEYAAAATDKKTSRQSVVDAAPRILQLALSRLTGVINVGDPPRTTLEYARLSRPDVAETTLAALGEPIPRDSTLDLTRWRNWLATGGGGEP